MEIRQAVAADWAGVYPFWARIVSAGETYAYPEDLSSEQAAELWMEKPPGHVVVAVDSNRVLGSAKMGPNRPGRGAHIGTASFMVDPEVSRRGVGRALADYAISWLAEAGYHGIQFNAVVETNVPAVHLWQTLGFEIIGTVPEAFQHLAPVHDSRAHVGNAGRNGSDMDDSLRLMRELSVHDMEPHQPLRRGPVPSSSGRCF